MMKALSYIVVTIRRRPWGLLSLALIMSSIILVVACGKLQDDSNDRPYIPSGSSSGSTIPMAPPDQLGDYKLTLYADDFSVPADGVSYTILHARLHNSAGLSVQNHIINFNTTPQSDAVGIFLNPETPVGTGTLSTTTTGRTDKDGSVSLRLLGLISGSCTVQATVDVSGDGTDDLFTTTEVVFTPSGPPDSAGGYRLVLSADPIEIPADGSTPAVITARLVDSSGGSVENFTITFEEPTALGSFSQDTAVTDENGEVVVEFSGTGVGTALIQATVLVNDLVGELKNTLTLTVFEVTIPDPVIIFETINDIALDYSPDNIPTAPLDVVIRVEDTAGNRIGGITLGYAIINRINCGGVTFSELTGEATTDITGRARIIPPVTGTAPTTAPHCSYEVEIIYEDVIYTSPTSGIIRVI